MARYDAAGFLNVVISDGKSEYSLAGWAITGEFDDKAANEFPRKIVKKIHNLATENLEKAVQSEEGTYEIPFQSTGSFIKFLQKNKLSIKLVVRDVNNHRVETSDEDDDIEL